jgi:uncharacterized protein
MNTISPARALVVSIHDVSPLTQQATQTFLDRLRALGVDKCSLLVIPNHHHHGHFLDDKNFCEWLIAQGAAGHEIVIHGYYHQRQCKAAESLWQRLMTQTYTQGEGEFYDINEAQATALVTKAQAEFAQLGFHPAGFIAPAWLLSEAGGRAVRKAGFAYTTRIGVVLNLASGARYDSPSMVYSVRNGWRRAVSLAWNASLFLRLKNNPLLRIGLHPPDLDHAAIWKHIAKYTALALEDRTPMTYWNWFSSQPDFQSQQ